MTEQVKWKVRQTLKSMAENVAAAARGQLHTEEYNEKMIDWALRQIEKDVQPTA